MSPNAFLVAAALATLGIATAQAETITRTGKNSAGQTCTVTMNRSADGSVAMAGASGGSATTSGGVSSSTSAGGTSVQVQAGNGSVSSSTTMPSGGASASVTTVNGCTITSP